MQPQEKRLTKQQIQGILDKTPKSIETADVITGLLGRGFILEGLNDQPIKKEPNLAQKTADMAVGWASNFGNTASAYLGAGLDQGLGRLAGKQASLSGVGFKEAVNRISDQNGKDTNVVMNDLFGRDAITRDLSTSEGRQGFGGDMLSGAATVFPAGKSIQGATLGAKALQGAKIGATVGALSGAGTSMQGGNDLATVGKDALVGAGVGGAFGAALPVAGEVVSKGKNAVGNGIKKVAEKVTPDPAVLMQRVARVSKGKQAAFKDTAGESVGEYLVNRGIFGTQDEVATKLFNRFQNSKQTADDALAKLQGRYKSEPVKTALDQLLEKKLKVSSPGAIDPEFNKVKELFNKNEKVGLSMSEINEVKRLYERGVKLDFVKENLPTEVQRASNIDNAIRSWQFEQADRLGLKNLPEINKETRLARQLLDDIGAENAGSAGNNLISLTDWVMLAGGDPTAIGGFLIKKGLTSQTAMSAVAKKVSPKIKVSESLAVMEAPKFDPKIKSFADFNKKITQQSLQKNQSNIQQSLLGLNREDISYNDAIIPQLTEKVKEVVSKDPSKAVQVIRDILSSMPDMSTLNRNELIKELTDLVNSLTE